MASAKVDEEIKRDTVEEETLLRQEDEHIGDIIKNKNYQDHDVNSSKSTNPQPKGEKEKTKKSEEIPAIKDKQGDQEDHRVFGLCRSGQCLSHYSCKDPLLYRRSTCDQLTNLLHTRRRYQICELSLKILTMAIILTCTGLVLYQFGLTSCQLTNRQEAIIQMNPKNNSMVKTKAEVVSKTLQDDDTEDEEDDEAKTSKNYKGIDTGIHKGKEQDQDQDQEDFTFDSDDSDDEKEKKDTDNEDNKKIVISFWP